MRDIGPFGLENRIFAGLCGIGALLVALAIFGAGFFGSLVFGIIVGVVVLLWLMMRTNDDAATATIPSQTPATSAAASATAGADVAAAPTTTATATPPQNEDAAADDAASDNADAPATASADAGDQDFDRDGVVEGTDEGAKPEMLTAAREDGADNLKEIKGVGPKMETMLNDMGVYHFDQIAGWTAQEVAWVDANLKGFKGRVSRDGWVDQAKILAAGGDTEFSKKVEKGGVY